MDGNNTWNQTDKITLGTWDSWHRTTEHKRWENKLYKTKTPHHLEWKQLETEPRNNLTEDQRIRNKGEMIILKCNIRETEIKTWILTMYWSDLISPEKSCLECFHTLPTVFEMVIIDDFNGELLLWKHGTTAETGVTSANESHRADAHTKPSSYRESQAMSFSSNFLWKDRERIKSWLTWGHEPKECEHVCYFQPRAAQCRMSLLHYSHHLLGSRLCGHCWGWKIRLKWIFYPP